MRSSKSRSRSNKNRNVRPTGGNIINRVFDSSGPDGKVRGTPAQIIEKYTQLHRDAQLSGDRVNAENFAQHAEHYTRILAEAQREIDKAREEQEQFNRDRQAERDRQIERDRERQAERQNGQNDRQQGDRQQGDRQQGTRPQGERPAGDRPQYDRNQPDRVQPERAQTERTSSDRDRDRENRFRPQEEPATDPAMMDQPELPAFLVRGLDMPFSDPMPGAADAQDSGLVDTPEAKPRSQQPRSQAPRTPKPPRPAAKPAPEVEATAPQQAAPAATETTVEDKPRTPRPRKPKAKPAETPDTGSAEAAE